MINNVFSMGVGVMYDFSGANEQQKEGLVELPVGIHLLPNN